MPSGARRSFSGIAGSFRRSFLGYRRAEVDEAVAELESEVGRKAEAVRAHKARGEELRAELDALQATAAAREQKLSWLEGELELQRTSAAHQLRGLAALGAELEEMRLAARGTATRIRLEALREAAEVSSRARSLGADPQGAVSGIFAALEEAIERLGAEWGELPAAATEPARSAPQIVDAAAELTALEQAVDGEVSVGALSIDPAAAARNGNGGDDSGSGRRVSVDVGPFRDFSQLVSFEDAANSIDATGEISIRRFSEGRASIDVSLSEPVDLLSELEQSCELDFSVRSRSDDEIILDLGE